MRLLFVCLGNICRSPTAEAVMRHLVEQRGLADGYTLDSAGTGGWHAGDTPDSRSTAAAARRGIKIEGIGRQVDYSDFYEFDLLLAMDRMNHRDLLNLAPDEEARTKVRLLREFDPGFIGAPGDELDVPDPYYGGPNGFDHVIDLVEAACLGLLDELEEQRS